MQVTGHVAEGNNIHGAADDDGRYTSGFQVSSCQTDSLMTDWSQGNQQGDVNFVFQAGLGYCRSVFGGGSPVAVLRWHEVIPVSETADTVR